MKTRATIIILALLFGASALAQNALELTAREVVPGMYALVSADQQFVGGTMALMSGDDGQVLIDGGIAEVTDALLAAIEDMVGDPVDLLINTHVHGDHTGSNAALHEAGATIIAHENIRGRLMDNGSPAAALPTITYDNGVTLYKNGFTLQVIHVENAHTDGDSIIYFPDVNVIHAGDVLFNGIFPFIDTANGGSVDGYLAAMSKIIAIADDETQIIAGHGAEIASRADVQAAQRMITEARSLVQPLVEAGLTEDEAVSRDPLAPLSEWNWDFIDADRMTRQMYQSL